MTALEIIPVYEKLDDYLEALSSGAPDPDALWKELAVEPYWPSLARFAPMDISDRQPEPIRDAESLKMRLIHLKRLDLPALSAEFGRAASFLPDTGDTMTVALYPLDSAKVRELQDGVRGVCTWGNIVLNIDPMASGFYRWLPYVFAHEYHHNVWGAYWYGAGRCAPGGEFVTALITDGLADSFALSLYPELRPKWIFGMPEETERRLWRAHYSALVLRTDVDYPKYMFGDEAAGIPWCAGYAIGYRIVQAYMLRHPDKTAAALLEIPPMQIFRESGYANVFKL